LPTQRLGVPYPLDALAAALAAGLLALPLMGLAIRRRGIYLAMITLAFGQMVFYVVNEWRSLTGGENGVQGIPRPALGGVDISSSTAYYYAAFPLAVLGLLRSEEHTSELQSRENLVCRLLLEKKKKKKTNAGQGVSEQEVS